MKTKNLLLISFLLFSNCIVVFSQTPILTTGNAPAVGDVFTYYTVITTSVNPGPSGANQTWDFSSLSVSSTTKSESFVAPSSLDATACGVNTGCNASKYFTSAKMAVLDLNGFISYYVLNGSKFYKSGYVTPGFSIRPDGDLQILITYPFTYQDSVYDTWNNSYNETGVSTTVADAYGTLKLPSKTYTNVLRVKYRDIGSESGSPFWDYVTYDWYDGTHKQPVLRIIQRDGATVGVYTFASGPNAGSGSTTTGGLSTDGINSSVDNFRIYPNPATQRTTLSYNLKEKSDISISFYNVIGVNVKTISKQILNGGNYSEEIDVQDLAKGIYFVSLNINNNTAYKGRLVIE